MFQIPLIKLHNESEQQKWNKVKSGGKKKCKNSITRVSFTVFTARPLFCSLDVSGVPSTVLQMKTDMQKRSKGATIQDFATFALHFSYAVRVSLSLFFPRFPFATCVMFFHSLFAGDMFRCLRFPSYSRTGEHCNGRVIQKVQQLMAFGFYMLLQFIVY